mmetsp:Transcript_322/g.508  ORF Transcript_322/g.508 Transcript_322/m.508 type:complete len:298 (+) Transcript_322:107-1000(+)
MKTRVLKAASLPLAALSLACSSAEVGAASTSIRGSILRNGLMDELTSEIIHAENIHRRLDEGNDEADHNDNVEEGGEEEEVDEEEEEEAAEYDDGSYESWETEDMQYADETEEATTTIMTKVQQYEDEAVQLFETAPAQWNAGQWDLLFALFGSVLVSCCVLSAFFAYCCIFREQGEDDVYNKKGRSLRKRRSNKGKDDDTVGSEYTKDESLLPSSRGGFSPRSWVSGSTYFSSNDKEDGKKTYSAPRAVVTSPTGTVTSIGFASVGEGGIIQQDTGLTPKSNIPHQHSGKSEVVEM